MHVIRKLIARGYWKPEGESSGGGGSAGVEPTAQAVIDAAATLAVDLAKTDDSGKNKPSDAEAKLLKEVMDKKTALKTANDQIEQVKAQLKAFEGLDPVAMRALVAEAAERTTKGLEEKGQWDALKKQLVDTHTVEFGLTRVELAKSQDISKDLNAKIAELTVGVAFGQSKFITGGDVSYSISKMRAFFGAHFEYDGAQVVAYDKPSGQKGRVVLMDSKGDPLPFEAALRKLVDADEDRDSILASKMKPGAGSKTDPKTKSPVTTAQLSGRSRIAAGLLAKSVG